MKIVILCGGKGTRIREETESRPKPMIEIGGYPILWHIMKLYSYYGFKDFVICMGYKHHAIRDYFLNYQHMNSDFTISLGSNKDIICHKTHQEDWNVTLVYTGLDTKKGKRLKMVADFLNGERFMLTYGDGVASINIQSLLEFHNNHSKTLTITGVNAPSRFGELMVA